MEEDPAMNQKIQHVKKAPKSLTKQTVVKNERSDKKKEKGNIPNRQIRFLSRQIFHALVRRQILLLLRRKTSKNFPLKKDLTKPPKGVTFITEITKVIPNFKGKPSHFFLKLKGTGKDLHLKCDDVNQTKRWVESLVGLSDFYRGKKIVDWIDERKDYKDEIDVRVLIMIMQEQESKPLG